MATMLQSSQVNTDKTAVLKNTFQVRIAQPGTLVRIGQFFSFKKSRTGSILRFKINQTISTLIVADQ